MNTIEDYSAGRYEYRYTDRIESGNFTAYDILAEISQYKLGNITEYHELQDVYNILYKLSTDDVMKFNDSIEQEHKEIRECRKELGDCDDYHDSEQLLSILTNCVRRVIESRRKDKEESK